MEELSLTMLNGDEVTFLIDRETGILCPVCGFALRFAPYNPETCVPSMDFCPSCEVQFGWDDKVPPDAPSGAQKEKWRELRETWLRDHSSHKEAEQQLKKLSCQ